MPIIDIDAGGLNTQSKQRKRNLDVQSFIDCTGSILQTSATNVKFLNFRFFYRIIFSETQMKSWTHVICHFCCFQMCVSLLVLETNVMSFEFYVFFFVSDGERMVSNENKHNLFIFKCNIWIISYIFIYFLNYFIKYIY